MRSSRFRNLSHFRTARNCSYLENKKPEHFIILSQSKDATRVHMVTVASAVQLILRHHMSFSGNT